MKKFILGFLLAISAFSQLNAQTKELSKVKRVYLNKIQAIRENNEVVGYFAFYFMDRVNSRKNLYSLVILDNNLQQTHYKEIEMLNGTTLLESAFNGETFCFSFLNIKKKKLEYFIYDKTLEEVGKYEVLKLSKKEVQFIQFSVSDGGMTNGTLTAIPGKGYIRHGFRMKKGQRMQVEMFDNKGEQMWTTTSGTSDKKIYEYSTSFYADDNMVVTNLNSRKKKLSGDIAMSLLGHKISDGEEMFRINLVGEKYQYMPFDVMVNKKTNQLVISGEYFDADDRTYKNKSEGMFIQVYDMKGELVTESLTSWDKEIAKLMPPNKKGEFKDMNVTIHRMVMLENGNMIAIGEQFRKTASALGIASQVLSRGNSGVAMAKVEIHDMMIFEFDNTFKLVKINVVDKDKSNILLPQGYSMLNSFLLAAVLKAQGSFDYTFTTLSADRTSFNSVYINYDREKGGKSKYVVGNISYTKENKIVTDQVAITTKPTSFTALPAKPGYVAIFEYFQKQKKIVIRLEKLNV